MDINKVRWLRRGTVMFLFAFVVGLAPAVLAKSPSELPKRTQKKFKSGVGHQRKGAFMRASWYGAGFHGRRAANGRKFDANDFTAAHRWLRLGTKLEVTNPKNGRKVVVEVTDRGPYIQGRELDLSFAAARELGIVNAGVARVEVRVLDEEMVQLANQGPIVIASTGAGFSGAWPRAIVR